MEQRPRAPRPLAETVGEHLDNLVVVAPCQVAVRGGAPAQLIEVVLAPLLARAFRHDLLREHVERRDGLDGPVEPPLAHRSDERGALDQLVPRGRKIRPDGRTPRAWPERPTRCKKVVMLRGEPIWQTRSIEPMSIPSSSDAVATSARSWPSLSRCSRRRRRSLARLPWWLATCSSADAQRELVGDALGEAARVHEDERGAVLRDQLGDAVVDLRPLLLRGHRPQLRRRQLDGQLEVALVAEVDDRAVRAALAVEALRPNEEGRDLLDRALRRGEPDPGRPSPAGLSHELVEAREGEREVAAAAVAGDGVYLVDDHGAHTPQVLAAALGGDHQVERLRRRDEDVRRPPHHRLPLRRRAVAAADGDADLQ